MGVKIKLRSLEWALKYSFKIFSAAAATFIINLYYPSKMQTYLHNLNIYSMLKYMNILCQVWASKNSRVMSSGPQKFSTAR